MASLGQQQGAQAVVGSMGSTRPVGRCDHPRIAELPFTVVVGAFWMVVVDAPRLISLGPISLSGVITMFVAALTLFMLPAYGGITAMRRCAGWVEPASARIPWAMWGFLLFVSVSFVITAFNGAIGTHSIQNASVYLLFVGAIAFAAAAKSSAVVLRGWELMRTVATCYAYLMLAMLVANLNLFGKRPMALVALIVLAVVIPGTPRNVWMKFAPFAAVAAMALSLSRTCTIIGIVCLIFIVLRGKREAKRGRRLFKSLLMLVTAAVSLYLLVVYYAPFRNRFLVGDNALQVGNIAISTEGRATLWKLLLSNSSDHWLLGHGLGSSGRLLAEHLPAVQYNAIDGHPHNDYLRFYFEFGIVGLALFIIGYLALIWRIFRSARKTDHPLHWAAVIALLAVSLSAITDNPLVYPIVMLPLGSLAGLSLALTRFETSDHRPAVANSNARQKRWRGVSTRT